jgi:isopenicillin N synthase-like dioxygenase
LLLPQLESAIRSIEQGDSMSGLPIIDLSGLFSEQLADRKHVAAELRAACLKHGFLYATGTGVTPGEMAAVLAASRRFFALPEHVKLALDKDRSTCGRGYERMGHQRLEAAAQVDLKEGFVIGEEIALDDPRAIDGWPLCGPNQWPAGMPEWCDLLSAYHARMTALAARIMGGLALSLGVAEDHFDGCCREAICSLRLLHYPPQPAGAGPNARGAGAHTDWGAVTILLQDDVGGLQVHDGSGGWIDAPPVAGSFIVNLGDLVPRWTNGLYRSTMHRVINTSGRERYSIAYFFDGRGDYVSECVPTCIQPGEVPKFAPLTVNQHLAEMFRMTRAA